MPSSRSATRAKSGGESVLNLLQEGLAGRVSGWAFCGPNFIWREVCRSNPDPLRQILRKTLTPMGRLV